FRHWSDDAADMTNAQRSRAGWGQLFSYMLQLIDGKRGQPAEDVISDLLAAQAYAPALTDHGIAQLSAGLLFAGHETTVAAVDNGFVLLAANPAQLHALQADPTLISSTVEEVLRHPDLVQPANVEHPGGLPRYAHADIDVEGVRISAGDLVLLALHEANVDTAV